MYVLRRLHADDDGDAGLGLHFDLTVPFARYVPDRAPTWTSRSAATRSRRCGCAASAAGGSVPRVHPGRHRRRRRDTLPFHHDVEVARVMAEALAALALPMPPPSIQVNNRKLARASTAASARATSGAVLRPMDKLDKVGPDGSASCSTDAGLSAGRAEQCLALATSAADPSFVEQVRALGVGAPAAGRGTRRAGRRRRSGGGAGARIASSPTSDRPRARLLHRHGLRDPARRARVLGLGVLRRPLRLAGHRRPDHLPRASASRSGYPRLVPVLLGRGLVSAPVRCRPACWSR